MSNPPAVPGPSHYESLQTPQYQRETDSPLPNPVYFETPGFDGDLGIDVDPNLENVINSLDPKDLEPVDPNSPVYYDRLAAVLCSIITPEFTEIDDYIQKISAAREQASSGNGNAIDPSEDDKIDDDDWAARCIDPEKSSVLIPVHGPGYKPKYPHLMWTKELTLEQNKLVRLERQNWELIGYRLKLEQLARCIEDDNREQLEHLDTLNRQQRLVINVIGEPENALRLLIAESRCESLRQGWESLQAKLIIIYHESRIAFQEKNKQVKKVREMRKIEAAAWWKKCKKIDKAEARRRNNDDAGAEVAGEGDKPSEDAAGDDDDDDDDTPEDSSDDEVDK